MRPSVSLVVGGIAVLGVLSGCGTTVLDTAKGEREIVRLVERYIGQKATATCPHDVPLKKGTQTACTVRASDGSTAKVRITQTDTRGNVSLSSQLMRTSMVQQRITIDASRRLGFPVTVACPKLIEISKGSLIKCTAIDGRGKTAPVHLTITDANGSFTYRIPVQK